MHRLIALSTASLIAMLPSLGYAACNNADLSGRWQAYISATFSSELVWARCVVRVLPGGSIEDVNCPTSVGPGKLKDGSLSITNTGRCTFAGSFDLGDGGNTFTVSHATIASDKRTAAGVGLHENEGGVFTFDMFKLN